MITETAQTYRVGWVQLRRRKSVYTCSSQVERAVIRLSQAAPGSLYKLGCSCWLSGLALKLAPITYVTYCELIS